MYAFGTSHPHPQADKKAAEAVALARPAPSSSSASADPAASPPAFSGGSDGGRALLTPLAGLGDGPEGLLTLGGLRNASEEALRGLCAAVQARVNRNERLPSRQAANMGYGPAVEGVRALGPEERAEARVVGVVGDLLLCADPALARALARAVQVSPLVRFVAPLCSTPGTLGSTPSTLCSTLSTLRSTPRTLCSTPSTLCGTPCTLRGTPNTYPA